MGKGKDKGGRDGHRTTPAREGRPQDSMGFQRKRPATTEKKRQGSDDADPEPRPWESKTGDKDEQD